MRPQHRASEGVHRVRLGGLAVGIAALVLAVSLAAVPPARAQEVESVRIEGQTTTSFGVFNMPVPGTVSEGGATSGTVVLAQTAGDAGITVSLTSSSADVTVPASVSVPAGQRQVSFTATAKWGATPGQVTIKAFRSGSTVVKDTSLNVRAVGIDRVTLPKEIGEGSSVEGRVRLTGTVGAGTVTVNLSVTALGGGDVAPPADATIPSSVSVAQGASEATFTLTVTRARSAGAQLSVWAARSGGSPKERGADFNVTAANVYSVTLQPASVPEGGPAAGTVTVIPAAPSGGITINLASSTGNVSVPATVTVAAGQMSATFTATGVALGTAQISAVRDGLTNAHTKTANLTVSRTQVGSLYFNPSSAIEGSTTTGTVVLDAPARDGGVTVSLSSSTTSASVPASVVVPKDATVVTFTATAVSAGSAEIKAVRRGETATKQATLTVAKNQVKSLAFDLAALFDGRSATGTIALDGPAAPGGVRVDLSSSNPVGVPVPSFVLVAGGAAMGTFTATATSDAAPGVVTISAARTGADVVKQTTLTVAKNQVKSLTVDSTIAEGGTVAGRIELEGPAGPDGVVVKLSRSSSSVTTPESVTVGPNGIAYQFAIVVPTGAAAGQVTITAVRDGFTTGAKQATLTVTRSGVKSLTFSPTPVVDTRRSTGTVELETAAPSSGVQIELSSSGPEVIVPVTTSVSAGQTTGTFEAFGSKPGTATITAKRQGDSAAKQTALTVNRNEVKSLALSPTSAVEGGTLTGTVTLDAPVGAYGVLVNLGSASAGITVPATVTVPKGSDTATFTVTGSAPGTGAISAKRSDGTVEKQATVTVNRNEVKSLSLSPTSVTEGKTATGTVTLEAAAGSGGMLVALSSSSAGVTVPTEVTVAAGATTATFTAAAKAPGSATLGAKRSGSTTEKGATLTVSEVQVKSVTFSPAEVKMGASVTGTVTLDAAAPPNFTLRLRSTSTSVSVPTSVTISPGSRMATFTVSAPAKATAGQATIEAERQGSGKATATLTIKK